MIRSSWAGWTKSSRSMKRSTRPSPVCSMASTTPGNLDGRPHEGVFMTFDIDLEVSDEVCALYSDLRISIIDAQNIDNTGRSGELRAEVEARADHARRAHAASDIADIPQVALWREAYRIFGAKRRDSVPTAEALLRRVLRGADVPGI